MRLQTRNARTHVRVSALKVASGRKIPCRTGWIELASARAGPMLYQLSYIPIPLDTPASSFDAAVYVGEAHTAFQTSSHQFFSLIFASQHQRLFLMLFRLTYTHTVVYSSTKWVSAPLWRRRRSRRRYTSSDLTMNFLLHVTNRMLVRKTRVAHECFLVNS